MAEIKCILCERKVYAQPSYWSGNGRRQEYQWYTNAWMDDEGETGRWYVCYVCLAAGRHQEAWDNARALRKAQAVLPLVSHD